MSGFSLTKFLLVLVAILIIVGSGMTATYFVLKQQQTASAQQFVGEFISKIEKNDPQSTFSSFSTTLKGDDQQVNYLTWYFWMSVFNTNENKVIIAQPPESVTYKNDSIINVIKSNESITFVYSTSANSKIAFEVVKSNNRWVLNNYAAL